MTLLQFKNLCEAKKRGDIKLPADNDTYQVLIQESLEYVAKDTNCVPIELLGDDCLANDKFRILNEKQYIRKPIATNIDTENIDIDDQLVYAVTYDFLANRTTNPLSISFYTEKRDEEISTYTWNNYKYLCELGLLK